MQFFNRAIVQDLRTASIEGGRLSLKKKKNQVSGLCCLIYSALISESNEEVKGYWECQVSGEQ